MLNFILFCFVQQNCTLLTCERYYKSLVYLDSIWSVESRKKWKLFNGNDVRDYETGGICTFKLQICG